MSLEAAQDICRQLGLKGDPVFLVAGATCKVYRVGEAVLRMGEGRFTIDAQLRRALLVLGVPVAEPLAVGENWSFDAFVGGQFSYAFRLNSYAITAKSDQRAGVLKGVRSAQDSGSRKKDGFQNGVSFRCFFEREQMGPESVSLQLTRSQAQQSGAAVSTLHTLPVLGWGLLRDQSGAFVGEAATLPAGVQTRLKDAWPFGTTPLERHPLMRFAPDLLPHLRPLEASILALADLAPVINHSDLHREQFLFEGEQLTGWLDFGDAVAGPPGWDAASFASFWGWERLPAFLTGYSSSLLAQSQLGAQARLMAVPLGFHRASRSAIQPLRLARAAAFVRAVVSVRTPAF